MPQSAAASVEVKQDQAQGEEDDDEEEEQQEEEAVMPVKKLTYVHTILLCSPPPVPPHCPDIPNTLGLVATAHVWPK